MVDVGSLILCLIVWHIWRRIGRVRTLFWVPAPRVGPHMHTIVTKQERFVTTHERQKIVFS